jgi:hypothetical protein
MDHPEKLVTLGTQDEEKQEWTIQRNLQHWVHKRNTNKNRNLWIVHSCFSSSCVPNVTSFSGFSILVCRRPDYTMLQVSLDCPFLFVLEACSIGCTRRRKTRMDNLEKHATLGTQDEEK